MISIILILSLVSILILLVGFFNIPLPFIISKAKAVITHPPLSNKKLRKLRKFEKRRILHSKIYPGFIENPI